MIKFSPDDHVAKAVAWILLGDAGGLSLDLFAKELLLTYSLQQFVLLRSLIAIALLLSIASRFGGLSSLRTDKAGWHLLRAVLAIGAMFGFFYGLANMPLVNAFTLGYTAPLMMTALIGGAIAADVIWDEVPDRSAVAGALIIVASGLFVVYRNKETGAVA